jgi:hypothetical protein
VYIPRLKFLVNKFDAMIQAGAESDLIIEYASQISAHQTSFTRVKEMPLGTPRTWQADATNQIVGAFEKSGFGQRCSVLVSGPPGIGKTSLGTFVGMELIKRKMGVTPIVFFFDPTAKGFDFFAALPTNDENIVVAMLDEYDAIVKVRRERSRATGQFRVPVYGPVRKRVAGVSRPIGTHKKGDFDCHDQHAHFRAAAKVRSTRQTRYSHYSRSTTTVKKQGCFYLFLARSNVRLIKAPASTACINASMVLRL